MPSLPLRGRICAEPYGTRSVRDGIPKQSLGTRKPLLIELKRRSPGNEEVDSR
jgi:hypothetical protein